MENKKITFEELEKHNKPHDAWIGINGKVYNVTNWMPIHPGGSDLLELTAGKEVTNLFESYHKLSTPQILGTEKVPYVGDLVTSKFPNYSKPTGFYPTLKKKVEKFFNDKKVNQREANTYVILNTIFITSGLIISYLYSQYSTISIFKRIFFAILAGVFHHLMMVHLLHDVSHSVYTSNPLIWRYFSLIGDVLAGHSIYLWMHRHVISHHQYTNPDVGIYKPSPKKPLMNYRVRLFTVPDWLRRYMYVLITLQMKLDDIISFIRGSMENCTLNDRSFYQISWFIFSKFVYYSQRVFLPIYLGYGIFTTLFLYIVTEFTSGLVFGYFSQITHIAENLECPIPWEWDRPVARDWAELQVLTANDFSHDSYFWTYLSGYLNYQVVHHLLPAVAPHYYPELLPIVKETCKEFNIEYQIQPSFWAAVERHFTYLKPFELYRKVYCDGNKS